MKVKNNFFQKTLFGRIFSYRATLSGQLSKSRKNYQCDTVNLTPIKRPPLLSGQLSKSRKNYQCDTVNLTPIKRPPSIKRPVIKVKKELSV